VKVTCNVSNYIIKYIS